MPKHSETRVLPYKAAEMYDLVADIARYPEFLPWCAATRIRSRVPDGACEVVESDMVVSFKVFREKFGTRVRLCPADKHIATDYLDGPFRYLHSNWRMRDVEGGCEVEFDIDFEFKSAILQAVIGVVFNEAMMRIVRAFEERAAVLYRKA